MINTELFRNLTGPKIQEISKAIVLQWKETDNYYKKYIPAKCDLLAKHMGKVIWKMGYAPKESHFEYECEQYDANIGLGIFCDVKMEKTYAQRFYPLFNAYEEAVEEIRTIKSKWWYKLFNLIGLVK